MGVIDEINEIVEEFEIFDDWSDKYEFIINLGQELKGIEEQYKTDEYKIRGCQSQVWLRAYKKDDKIFYEADSDALIVKGLAAVLLKVYSGQNISEVLSNPPKFMEDIGLGKHLSPTRSNGLNEMIKKIFYYAEQYK